MERLKIEEFKNRIENHGALIDSRFFAKETDEEMVLKMVGLLADYEEHNGEFECINRTIGVKITPTYLLRTIEKNELGEWVKQDGESHLEIRGTKFYEDSGLLFAINRKKGNPEEKTNCIIMYRKGK